MCKTIYNRPNTVGIFKDRRNFRLKMAINSVCILDLPHSIDFVDNTFLDGWLMKSRIVVHYNWETMVFLLRRRIGNLNMLFSKYYIFVLVSGIFWLYLTSTLIIFSSLMLVLSLMERISLCIYIYY